MNFDGNYCLAELFQDHMMFQRDKKIHIWGKAPAGTRVTASFYREGDGETALSDSVESGTDKPVLAEGTGQAGKSGDFHVVLPPLPAGEGYQLSVRFEDDPGASILLKDILFGDIWLACGQSNMEFFLKYDRDWEKAKKLPRDPKIRLYNVPQRAFVGHTSRSTSGYGYWFDDSDPGLAFFSAPGYSFAREVREATGIPIGVIGCNWGGTTASAWVKEEVLSAPPLDRYLKEYEEAVAGIPAEKLATDSLAAWAFEDSPEHSADFEPLLYGRDREWQLAYMEKHAADPVIPMGPYNINRPAGLYHTMLSELIPFSIKGVLWYQGESDAGDYAPLYDKLLGSLIDSWRKAWGDPFPFLLVQLAPFGVWLDCDSKGYATVRERQALVADSLPDVHLASIMDLGSYYDIHPKEKMEVGRRLALLARGHVYEEEGLLCDAPKALRAFGTGDGQIIVTFLHGEGLTEKMPGPGSRNPADNSEERTGSCWNIQIDGQDIPPAKVLVEEGRVLLTLPESAPRDFSNASVSLGWDDYAEIWLCNRAGLSAAPFKLTVEKENSDEKTSF